MTNIRRVLGPRAAVPLLVQMVVLFAGVVAAVLALPGVTPAAVRTPFEPPRFSTNDTGNITITGNTLMTCPAAANNCLGARNGTGRPLDNNNFRMEYVDVDSDPATFNSSAADFDLPAGGEVLWAGLYWGGRQNDGPRDQVQLRLPGSAAYQPINGQIVGSFAAGGDARVQAYHAFENVTDLVRQGGAGTYGVANVQAEQGPDRYAGWSLVVAYRRPGAPPRNLTVFDGFADITNTNNERTVDIPISGFRAPPTGAVNARLGVVAYEGDLGLIGDSLRFKGGNNQDFTVLSNQFNPANNFFNSTISRPGFRLGLNDKDPDYINQLGFDADIVDASAVIPNGARSAVLRLNTVGDTYFPGVLTTEIELYAPNVELDKTVTDLNGGQAEPGDVLEYDVTATNTGQDLAENTFLRDAIPANTTYVPDSLRVTSGANAGPKTDQAGDDQAEFSTGGGNDEVVFRLGQGADATDGGTLDRAGQPGNSTSIRFQVTVEESARGTTIENQASTDYFGPALERPFSGISNRTETPVEPIADLAIIKTGDPASVRVGQRITYTLNVVNNGPNRATDVTVTDDLPPGVALVSAVPSTGTCAEVQADAVVTCGLGTLERGATATIEIVVEAAEGDGEVINISRVTSPVRDPNPRNNESRTETTIRPRPPVPGVELEYVCGLGDGDAIWRISRSEDAPEITFTTTRGAGPEEVTLLPGRSTFRGRDVTTGVRFSASGFSPQTVTREPGDARCEGTLVLDKIVRGDGPAGPYEVEVREGTTVVETANVTAPDLTRVTLPTGFFTNDYPGFTSQARGPFTVEETGTRGADSVTYDPGQEVTLSNGQSRRVTVTNRFFPDAPGDLEFVCNLGGGEAIWRIINPPGGPELTFTTTQGTGPQEATALSGNSTFRGSYAETSVLFGAEGDFSPKTVTRQPGEERCEGTLVLEKIVTGGGIAPDGPYTVEVREGATVRDTVQVAEGETTRVTLPAGFVTDDYPGYTSGARGPYTVVETGTRGADSVTYAPGQDFSLVRGDTERVTITNTFEPEPITGVDFEFVCGLNGDAIWRIINRSDIEELEINTTEGRGPQGVLALDGTSTFRGSNAPITIQFTAPGYEPLTVEEQPDGRACEGTLILSKVVLGGGPDGPYEVQIREGDNVIETVEVTPGDPTEVTLPAGFFTDDYPGFESRERGPYTLRETDSQGAVSVRYSPQDGFRLADGETVRGRVTNAFCADLSVKVKAPNRVQLGKNFTYTVTATNSGPANVTDAVLTSRLPNSVEFVRAGDDCRYDRAVNKVTCNIGNVAAGESKQREIVVKAVEAGTVRLQGCAVKSGTPDCDPSDNQIGSVGGNSTRSSGQTVSGVGPVTTVVAESPEGSS